MLCHKCKEYISVDHAYRIIDKHTVEHVDCNNPYFCITAKPSKTVPLLVGCGEAVKETEQMIKGNQCDMGRELGYTKQKTV